MLESYVIKKTLGTIKRCAKESSSSWSESELENKFLKHEKFEEHNYICTSLQLPR